MTKQYSFYIDNYQAKWIFSPIRDRISVIKLLMKSIKIMLVNNPPHESQRLGKIVLNVSDMSRLIFESKNKLFSIYFPFTTIEGDEGLEFSSKTYQSIDNQATSSILELIELPKLLTTKEILEFADPILDKCSYDKNLWALLRELLLMEDGYIRYDHDPVRVNKHKHPLNHLDIFYTQGNTFKLGSPQAPEFNHLIDILDIGTDSHYVRKADK